MSGFISTTPAEREAMLARIGVATLDDLFRDLPAKHYRPHLDLPAGLSEMETWQYLRGLSETNLDLDRAPSFLGAGAYRHYTRHFATHPGLAAPEDGIPQALRRTRACGLPSGHRRSERRRRRLRRADPECRG